MVKAEVKRAQKTEGAEQPKIKWGPVTAIAISILAYIAAQLILIIPLALIANNGRDVQATLNDSAWLQLALTGLSSAALIGVLWLFLHQRKSNFKELGFRPLVPRDIAWVILGLVVYYVVLVFALSLANLIPNFNLEQTQTIGYQSANGWQLSLAFLGLVILPPLAEETLFRGFLYRGLANHWPKIWAALIASLLFAIVHFQWNVGIDVFVLSMVMIMLYEKTKNLWVCVALHALKNLIAFLILFVFKV